ncbi:unnamed protein product, partial [marine sediment metagenome]
PIIQVEQKIRGLSAIGTASKSAILSASVTGAFATGTILKSGVSIKADVKLKSLLRQEARMRITQTSAMRSALITKQALKITPSITTIGLPPVSIVTPKLPLMITPPPIPIPINIPDILGRIKKRRKKRTKQIQELLYIPDFTARAIGLKAEIITMKQAQAKLKKVMTGLEVRRGVRIKSDLGMIKAVKVKF